MNEKGSSKCKYDRANKNQLMKNPNMNDQENKLRYMSSNYHKWGQT